MTYPDPPLSDRVVWLRPWAYTDVDCVEQASADSRIPDGTSVPTVYTEDAGHAWIERQWGRLEAGEGLSLAITPGEHAPAIGDVVLLHRPQPGVAGIGYWILSPWRRHGLATRAVGLLARWALHEATLARVEALVEPDNHASQRVLERVGFTREGRLRALLVLRGTRRDALIYSLLPTDAGARLSPADQAVGP